MQQNVHRLQKGPREAQNWLLHGKLMEFY